MKGTGTPPPPRSSSWARKPPSKLQTTPTKKSIECPIFPLGMDATTWSLRFLRRQFNIGKFSSWVKQLHFLNMDDDDIRELFVSKTVRNWAYNSSRDFD